MHACSDNWQRYLFLLQSESALRCADSQRVLAIKQWFGCSTHTALRGGSKAWAWHGAVKCSHLQCSGGRYSRLRCEQECLIGSQVTTVGAQVGPKATACLGTSATHSLTRTRQSSGDDPFSGGLLHNCRERAMIGHATPRINHVLSSRDRRAGHASAA